MARKRKRKKTTRRRRRPVSRRRRVTRRRRRPVSRRRRRRYKTRAKKPLGRYRGRRRAVRSGRRRGGYWARGRRRRRTYATVRRRRRSKKGRRFSQRYYVRKNPLQAIGAMVKDGVYTYVGVLGIRALCHVLDQKVFKASPTFSTGAMGKIAPVLPAAAGMLIAALAPRFLKGQPKIVQGLQAGATLVFFDAVLTQVIKATAPTMAPYLLPGATVVATTPAVSEYVASPMGLEVEEAMALNEYVADPAHQLSGMGGMNVEEALAADEQQAFESGYAGGSMRGTVFGTFG